MVKLKKELGILEVTFLCAGAIIGSGIFIIPGIGASILGFSSLYLWALTGILAVIMAMVFAEVSSMYENAGGIYTYVKDAFGEKIGFITGWSAWVISWTTVGMLAVAGIDYLSAIIPLNPIMRVVTAVFVVLVLTVINSLGIKHGAKTQLLLTGFTLLFLIGVVVVLSPSVNLSSIKLLQMSQLDKIAFLLAATIIIEPYIGWQEATFVSKEKKNGRKIVPKGIVYGTIIVAAIYFVVALFTMASSYLIPGGLQAFASSNAPLFTLFSGIFPFGDLIIVIGAVVIIFGCLNSWITTSSRLPYGMARDGTLPNFFSKLSENSVPFNALIFQLVVSALIIFSADFILKGGFELLLKTMIPIALFIYFLVFLSVLRLRDKFPRRKRYFKLPLPEAMPLLSALYVFGLALFLIITNFSLVLKGGTLIGLGIPFYFLVKMQTDKKFTEKFFDKFSFLWDKLFPVWYGEKEIKKVVNGAKVKKSNQVMDFGCGTGYTTLELAKKVGDEGTVVAVDLSRKQLEKNIKKVEQAMEFSNVVFIKETELIPFENNLFDSIVGVGVLEHFKNPRKKLKTIFKFLKKGGRFSFLSFGRSFGIPAPEYLKNEKAIKQLFKKVSSTVRVEKKRKRGTQYWFIYGKK